MSDVASPAVVAGWYPDGRGGQAWWNGQAWAAPTVQKPGWYIHPDGSTRWLADGVWGRSKPKTNHVLHLLLSVFTLGLWLPVWLIIAVSNR